MNDPTRTEVPPSAPGRHLLRLIIDALAVPAPAPTPANEAACLALLSRRAGAVLAACRLALSSAGDAGALYAERDLYGAVSGMPATGYRHAEHRPVITVARTPEHGGDQ